MSQRLALIAAEKHRLRMRRFKKMHLSLAVLPIYLAQVKKVFEEKKEEERLRKLRLRSALLIFREF